MNSYYGQSLSSVDYDRIAVERFPRKWLKHESELQQLAWFDYRFMHPTERTYLFAHYYKLAFQEQYGRVVDYDSRTTVNGYARQDPLDNRGNVKGHVKDSDGQPVLDEKGLPVKKIGPKLSLPTMIWRARQIADAGCLPYDFFATVGLRIACDRLRQEKNIVRSAKSGAGKLLVGPQHLYTEDVYGKTLDQWRSRQLSSLRFAEDKFYKQEQFSNHAYQLSYEDYLITHISQLINKEFVLAQTVYIDKTLRESRALENFNEGILRRAKKISNNLLD